MKLVRLSVPPIPPRRASSCDSPGPNGLEPPRHTPSPAPPLRVILVGGHPQLGTPTAADRGQAEDGTIPRAAWQFLAFPLRASPPSISYEREQAPALFCYCYFLLLGCIVGLLTRAGFSPSYKANPARILHSSPIGYWVNQ
jgi:hypothetical protein